MNRHGHPLNFTGAVTCVPSDHKLVGNHKGEPKIQGRLQGHRPNFAGLFTACVPSRKDAISPPDYLSAARTPSARVSPTYMLSYLSLQ